MDVTQYIRESCEHQNATKPEDFIGMTRAYEHALSEGRWQILQEFRRFTFHLAQMANLINNRRALDGPWRQQPAHFENGNWASDAEHIPRQLQLLFENISVGMRPGLSVDEVYWGFEGIHPFTDGNGRVGSLLWNILNGTILNPEHPPIHPDWIS